jgi:hypothetical protein
MGCYYGTRQKHSNIDGIGLKIAVLYFLALSMTSLNILKRNRRRRYWRRRQKFLRAFDDGGKKF